MNLVRTAAAVLLCVAVVGAAAVLATSRDTRPTDEQKAIAAIRMLGDADADLSREAEARLRALGRHALPALREACGSREPRLAAHARRLLDELEGDGRPAGMAP